MTASLVLAWYFPEQQRALTHDFVIEEGAEISQLVREVAAAIEVVDGGASLWRGIAGDWERLFLEERSKRREMEELLGWADKVIA